MEIFRDNTPQEAQAFSCGIQQWHFFGYFLLASKVLRNDYEPLRTQWEWIVKRCES